MPPSIHLTSDSRLGTSTIVTSLHTAGVLRSIIGNRRYTIKYSPLHSDDEISISPDLYDAFEQFLTNLSGTHEAV